MKNPESDSLRKKAEERVRMLEQIPDNMDAGQLKKLAHELQVYKIELEMQNEELKKTQEELNRSFEQFYSLFHNAPVGYLICNEIGIIKKANATFYYMLKLEDDIIGKSVVEYMLSDDKELFLSRYKAFFKNPSNKNIDVKLKTSDHKQIICRLEGRIFSINDNEGKQSSELLISFTDITETKKAYKSLKENEEQLRTLINNMPDIVCFKDGNGRWIVANEFDLNLFQLTNVEYKNKKDSELAEHSPFYKEAFLTCETSDEIAWKAARPIRSEEIIPTPDGSQYVFDIIKVPTYDEEGNRKGLIVLGRDITEKKKAELQLLQERDLFTAGPVFTIEWEPSKGWPVSYVSSNVEHVLGYKKEELLDKQFRYADIIHPDDLGRITDEVSNNILNNNDAFEQSYRMKNKSGEYRWFFDFTKFVRNDKGTLTKISGYVYDQTRIKLNEIQLQEERTRLSNIIKGTNVGTWEWNIQTGETVFNERWAEIIGYSLNELEPLSIETWVKYVHPEDLQKSNELLKKHFTGELDYYECESRMKHKSGKWIWVLDRGRVVSKTADGLPLMMYGTHLDITRLKEEENLLLKSALQLKQITSTSIDGFWITDLDGHLISVNDAYCNLTNYSREELLKMSIYDLDINEKVEDTIEHIAEIVKKGYGRFETQHKCKDGRIIDVEISTTYSKSSNNIMAFINDITERKKIENQLIESERKFRSYIENAFVGVLISDQYGKHIESNPFIGKMFGYNQNEIINTNILDLVDESMFSDAERHFKDVASIGYANGEFLLKKKNGEKIWAIVTASRISEERYLAVFHDITELKNYKEHLEELVYLRTKELDLVNKSLFDENELRKQAEKQLEESLQKEKELNTLKSRFISTASHEFRTPLTSILASTELIQRYYDRWSIEKISEHLNRIKNSTHTLTRLMDDVIKVNRAESGRDVLELKQVNLHLLCKKVIDDVNIHLKNDHDLIYDFEGIEDGHLLDVKFMEAILQNLLSNAIKYSPGGGVIKFSVSADQDEIRIKITDSGLGIPNEDISNIFTPFNRATNSKDIQGTGLGLSIVKHAVDLHGGSIEVESQENIGTTFIVKIPSTREN